METSLKVTNPWAGSPVFVSERTGSTMDDARRLALAGCAEGTVALAGFQAKGRGRGPDKSWHSKPWECLMATVVLDKGSFRFPVGELPLRAAVATCLAVADFGVKALIKLPNDLLVGGRKIAGILCETCNQCVLVGFGVNCLQTEFRGDLLDRACSILQLTGREVNPIVLLPRVLTRLKETLEDERWEEKLGVRLIRKDAGSASSSAGQLS